MSTSADKLSPDSATLISFDDSPSIGAFNRARVANPYTLLDFKQTKDNLPLFFDDQEVSGGGTSSEYQTNKASTKISVTNNVAGKRVRQSFLYGNYQPGKSLLVVETVNFAEDKSLSVCLRSNTSGTPVDTVIPQSQWNQDTLDGSKSHNNPSGYKIDFSKSQILYMDFEWLGVGMIQFGIMINRQVIWVHRIQNANIIDTSKVVYMSNPNQPVRYEIESDGSNNISKRVGYFSDSNGVYFLQEGTNTSLYHICSTVISEGGQEQNAIATYISRDGVPITLAAQDLYTPVLSLRLKSDHICTRISAKDISVLLTTNTNYEWALFLEPTIAGTDLASWQSVTNSALEYDVTRNNTNTLSGGFKLAGGYGASSATSKTPIYNSAVSFLTIGSYIDGTPQELVLGVKNVDGNGGTCYAGINLNEYC